MSLVNPKRIRPLALTSLVSLLVACGGDSASVNENPDKGIETSTNGCLVDNPKCQTFIVDYPAAGLNFDCSSDKTNHFGTELIQNVVTGGCTVQDSVKLYIQGARSEYRISLGDIDLKKLNPIVIPTQPTQIGVLDIASSMTGKDALKSELSDDTFRVMVGLVRLFQAVGLKQDANVAGDIQPIIFDAKFKEELSKIGTSINVNDFLDGSYVSKLDPWVKVSAIDQDVAVEVAKKLLYLSNVSIYKADFMALSMGKIDVGGFHGKSLTTKESIANLYVLTTRQGFSTGYAVQWTGIPLMSEGETLGKLARLRLLTQELPQKLDAAAQQNWINPLNKKMDQELVLKAPNSGLSQMQIYQGKFLNGNTIPGNEYMYKRLSGDLTAPADNSVYGKWKQELGNDLFTGSIDIYRTNPATYLDKRVFLTEKNVKKNGHYIFPLYADLIFDYGKETSIPKVKVSIVIDENGDIRTNRSAQALASEQCSTITDPVNYVDNLGVQQYRIGTTGAANYMESDKSVTIRMILNHPIFADLNGALIGLNDRLLLLPPTSEQANASLYASGGVRINLQNLIVNKNTSQPINITGWGLEGQTLAQWGNMHAIMQSVYNEANKDKTTPAQVELARHSGGNINIDLPKCYQVKFKS